MKNFGEFLYTLRKEKGMTQAELADRLDITNKAVSKWETGESFPETAQLVPIARIFGVSVDELLKGERDINNPYVEKSEEFKAKPFSTKEATRIAVGVGLILIGVLLMIVIDSLTRGGFGVPLLFVFVSVAVVLFVNVGLRHKVDTVDISDEKKREGYSIVRTLSIGIMLAVLSPGLLILLNTLNQSHMVILSSFFVLVAIAVMIMIIYATGWGNFAREHKIPIDDDNNLPKKARNISDALCGSIMLIATAIFLILGLVYGKWHPSWVVFPIGGILCGVVSTIVGSLSKD